MATRMQQRRGTETQWTTADPILGAGEIGFESDTNKFKIGDGINHWSDLAYFADAPTLGGSIDDYIPLTQKGVANGVAELDGNGKLASLQIPNLDEITQDILDTSLVAGTGLDKTYNDSAGTYTLDIDSTVATKTFAAELLTNATKTNITITGNSSGLTITAENGVADSNTDNLTEGSTNKYFTDERAQDAVGNSVGTGLSYNDSTGAISVDTAAIQAKVSGVTDTEIGYLDGVTSAIQTQIDAKLASATAASTYAPLASPTFTGTVTLPANTISQSMMSDDSVGTNEIGGLAVTEGKIASSAVTEGKIADGAVTSAKIADGTIVNADINASAAIAQSKIDGLTSDLSSKLALAGGTMTGAITLSGAPTSDLHAATKLYVDNVTAGINFHEAVHAASTTNLAVNYSNGTSGVGATLTADTNRAFATLDGESVTLGQRVLIKDQTDAKQNGIYTLTTVGSGSAPWVLTRATDADNNPAGEIKNGDFCLVINGTVNASYGFINNSATNPIVIGTDNITYTQFNAGKTVVAGNGLQEATPGTLSIDTTITQTRVSGVSDTEIGYLDGVTSGIQGQLDAKAPLASPTFTGTVTIPNGAALGTPASATLTNATGLPVSTGISGLGTGIATALAVNTGSAGAPVLFNGALGTPSSGTLTNATGLPVSSGISGLGTGVATALAVNTGSAGAVALFNGALGTPSSVTLTNATGLPVATGISGLGTNVATFLATPSSANFASMISDEIGTGNVLLSDMATSAQTASYTLVLADKAKVVEMNVATANNLTIPTEANVAFPVGTQIHVVQTGAGQTTIVAPSGGTANTATTLKLRAQWSAATLIKRATNTWVVVGDLATS